MPFSTYISLYLYLTGKWISFSEDRFPLQTTSLTITLCTNTNNCQSVTMADRKSDKHGKKTSHTSSSHASSSHAGSSHASSSQASSSQASVSHPIFTNFRLTCGVARLPAGSEATWCSLLGVEPKSADWLGFIVADVNGVYVLTYAVSLKYRAYV